MVINIFNIRVMKQRKCQHPPHTHTFFSDLITKTEEMVKQGKCSE